MKVIMNLVSINEMKEIVSPLHTPYNTGVYHYCGKFYDRYKLELSDKQVYDAVWERHNRDSGEYYATQQADIFKREYDLIF